MSRKKGLINADIFLSNNRVTMIALNNAIKKQKWIAMRQAIHDFLNLHNTHFFLQTSTTCLFLLFILKPYLHWQKGDSTEAIQSPKFISSSQPFIANLTAQALW